MSQIGFAQNLPLWQNAKREISLFWTFHTWHVCKRHILLYSWNHQSVMRIMFSASAYFVKNKQFCQYEQSTILQEIDYPFQSIKWLLEAWSCCPMKVQKHAGLVLLIMNIFVNTSFPVYQETSLLLCYHKFPVYMSTYTKYTLPWTMKIMSLLFVWFPGTCTVT